MVPEPALPDSVSASDLDTEVRRDLRGLQKETAEKVARHLVAAGLLVDEEPERALAHVRYARRRGSRIAVVREAAGIVAYHAGEWNEALGEFRAARRMGGGPGHVPVMADIERALGRPERALELTRGPEVRDLGTDERVELLIVAAGARRDMGELDAAVVGLQTSDLDPKRRDPWSARLFYAYADNLLAAGRRTEAVQWFVHAHDADTEQETDAAERIADLTGDELPGSGDDGVLIGVEDVASAPGAPDDLAGATVQDSAEEVDGEPSSGGAALGTEQQDPSRDGAEHDADLQDEAGADLADAAGLDDPEADTTDVEPDAGVADADTAEASGLDDSEPDVSDVEPDADAGGTDVPEAAGANGADPDPDAEVADSGDSDADPQGIDADGATTDEAQAQAADADAAGAETEVGR